MGNSVSLAHTGQSKKSSAVRKSASNGGQGSSSVGKFTSSNSTLSVLGMTSLDPRKIRAMARQARLRRAYDIQRVSFLWCGGKTGLSNRSKLAMLRLISDFLRIHAPDLKWLSLTGPTLLETNGQACYFLHTIRHQDFCQNLEGIHLGVGQIANADFGHHLGELIQHAPKLHHVILYGLCLQNVDAIEALISSGGLAWKKQISWLDLTLCRITDQGFQVLVEQDGTMSLETLILRSNNFTHESLATVATLITRSLSLKTLNLSHMPLFLMDHGGNNNNRNHMERWTEEGLESFLRALRTTTTLQDLNLCGCGMNADVMKQLLLAASESQSVDTLHLSDNLHSSSPEEVLQLLTQLVPRLNLSAIHLRNKSFVAVVSATATTEAVTAINNPGFNSTEMDFLRALSQNRHLTHLSLPDDEQSMSSSGLGWVKKILQRNRLDKRLKGLNNHHFQPVNPAVWPFYLQRTTPSLTYQLLNHTSNTFFPNTV